MKAIRPPPRPQGEDPNRAALVEILRELNKSEETAQDPNENGLEQDEIVDRLVEFWAVKEGKVQVPAMISILLQNSMVEYLNRPIYSWVRQRNTCERYKITSEGKEFLRANIVSSQRIS